jgi:hypothetical protein
MKNPIKIYCEVYGRNILAFYEWDQKEFERHMIKYYCSDFKPLDGVDGCHVPLEKGTENLNVIWTRKSLSKTRSFIILAHEALHCAVNILKDAGVPVVPENDEVLCYYQGFLLKKIMEYKLK